MAPLWFGSLLTQLTFYSLCWLQAYIYLNEGERLLKTLRKEKSWSKTFESAAFYTLKGQVREN